MRQKLLVNGVIRLEKSDKNNLVENTFVIRLRQPLRYRSEGHLSRFLLRIAKEPCGYTAEGNTFEPIRLGSVEASTVAGPQLVLLRLGRAVIWHHGARHVKDVLAWQRMTGGDKRGCARRNAVRAMH